jgi:hypothetical protein
MILTIEIGSGLFNDGNMPGAKIMVIPSGLNKARGRFGNIAAFQMKELLSGRRWRTVAQ